MSERGISAGDDPAATGPDCVLGAGVACPLSSTTCGHYLSIERASSTRAIVVSLRVRACVPTPRIEVSCIDPNDVHASTADNGHHIDPGDLTDPWDPDPGYGPYLD